jgi:hypothetical protein
MTASIKDFKPNSTGRNKQGELLTVSQVVDRVYGVLELVRQSELPYVVGEVTVSLAADEEPYIVFRLHARGEVVRFVTVAGERRYMVKRCLFAFLWDILVAGDKQLTIEDMY